MRVAIHETQICATTDSLTTTTTFGPLSRAPQVPVANIVAALVETSTGALKSNGAGAGEGAGAGKTQGKVEVMLGE